MFDRVGDAIFGTVAEVDVEFGEHRGEIGGYAMSGGAPSVFVGRDR